MDQWDQWSKNITDANGAAGSNIFRNYAVSKVGIDATSAANTGGQASVQAKIDDINRSNAEAAAKLEAQKAQDATDPGKAQMQLLPDNKGYAFYDGTGKQININQYSLLTGKRPDQILADSPVAKDQKFAQDYKTLMALSTAWVNGDTKTLDKLRAADPKKFNNIISTYKSPADMVSAFTKHWSDYYGDANGKQTSGTGAFAPQQINEPTKQQSTALATGSLGDVLTPYNQPNVKHSSGIKGLIEKTPVVGALTGYHDEIERQKKYNQANPWFAYHNSLYGN